MTGLNRKTALPAVAAGLLILCLFSGCQTINRTKAQVSLPDNAVVFTFDDGPNGDATARLLDVLKKYGIHAAFALLGENVEHDPELAKRIFDEGHTIINHGYRDKWAVMMSAEEFRSNLAQGEEALAAALGEIPRPLLYRPQGGFYRKQHEKIWQEAGYRMVPGTARPYDAVATAKDKDRIVEWVIKKLDAEKGGIILLHDGHDSWRKIASHLKKDGTGEYNRTWIPDAVEEIIILLQKNSILRDALINVEN